MFGDYHVLATPDGRSFAYGYLRQSNDLFWARVSDYGTAGAGRQGERRRARMAG